MFYLNKLRKSTNKTNAGNTARTIRLTMQVPTCRTCTRITPTKLEVIKRDLIYILPHRRLLPYRTALTFVHAENLERIHPVAPAQNPSHAHKRQP